MIRNRYRPLSLIDISLGIAPQSFPMALMVAGLGIIQGVTLRRGLYYCSAPVASMRNGIYSPICFQEVRVSEENEEIPYMCER